MYRINEIFYSLQGEGIRSGTSNVFVRFTGCNQTCKLETHGFDCDTEFTSGIDYSLGQLIDEISKYPCKNIILTGGEPTLQVDNNLVNILKVKGYYIAIETNGSINIDNLGIDWITVSPKTAEHCLRQLIANEVKYVRNIGQGIPKTKVQSQYKLISPAFNSVGTLDKETLNWCIKLVKENPDWQLTVQYHKIWKMR